MAETSRFAQPERCARRSVTVSPSADLIVSSSTAAEQRLFDDVGHAGLLRARNHFLGLVAHHQNDGKAKPDKAALVVAVQHARKYVVIEHEAARRVSLGHGARQGMLVAKPHIEALEPEGEAQGVGQDPVAHGNQNG